MKKKVLVLGACGNIGPFLTPGLAPHYDLTLADIRPHPDGLPVQRVDVSDYSQVHAAMAGMDAVINLTVLRDDPAQSFAVNTRGMYHLMRAAVEHGIKRIIHTGPQSARYWFDHDFGIDDIPEMPGTGYYMLTKYLSLEIARTWSRTHGIQTLCFLFNGLGPSPTSPIRGEDFPPFTVVWEDLQHACRLALEVESVPDNFQCFNLHSYLGQGKYLMDKATRLLGHRPVAAWADYYRRLP
ncbi:MAG: NAD(P)-dependent oxidoreductase [Candidatus Handelsmanbacteria bacterium]|nr:NAD(P)-dependent oxidoreductase [Candidatus Handelsmanbacteria bacterium]